MPQINPTAGTRGQQGVGARTQAQEIETLLQDLEHIISGNAGPLPSGQNRNLEQIRGRLQQIQRFISPQTRQELVAKATSTQDEYASLIQDQAHITSGNAGPLPSGRPAASRAVITQQLAQVKELNTFYNRILNSNRQE